MGNIGAKHAIRKKKNGMAEEIGLESWKAGQENGRRWRRCGVAHIGKEVVALHQSFNPHSNPSQFSP